MTHFEQKVTSITRCQNVDLSSGGAKFGPPTPATSSCSNQRTRLATQSSGTQTSSSVNRTRSHSTISSAMLHASALVRLPASSIQVALFALATASPGSPVGPTMAISKSPFHDCLFKPPIAISNSSALRRVGMMTHTRGLAMLNAGSRIAFNSWCEEVDATPGSVCKIKFQPQRMILIEEQGHGVHNRLHTLGHGI